MKTNKIATRVFLLIAAFLLLLFFSNDFGLIDIQKTSIITAIREKKVCSTLPRRSLYRKRAETARRGTYRSREQEQSAKRSPSST